MMKIRAFWDQKRTYIKKYLLNSTSHRTSCSNCGSYLNNLLVMPLLRHHHIQSRFILFHPFCLILGPGLFRLKIHKIPHTWSTVQSWFGSVFFSGDYLFLMVNFTDEFSVPCLLWRQTNHRNYKYLWYSSRLFQFKTSIFTENQILEKANHPNKYTSCSCMTKASAIQLKQQKNTFVRT